MRAWTVHLPPAGVPADLAPPAARPVPAAGTARPQPPAARGPGLALVPEGFSIAAMLFGPLWLLRHGQWLALLLWLALGVLLALLLPAPLHGMALLAMALMTGLQGQDIRRWTLSRQGRPVAAVVLGRHADAALARALEARPDWAAHEWAPLQGKPA